MDGPDEVAKCPAAAAFEGVMTRGFLLGKFLPPHNGHVFLCDFARHYCDRLTILVCTLARDPVPGELRYGWMRELFPDCRVVHHAEDIPQAPDEHPAFWRIWRELIRRVHPEPIDHVFASESYGARLAEELGARFVPVDPMRLAVPVSGREVLADPFAAWSNLPAPVRAHFVKTVCLFGPESTGKSILAKALARHFRTVFVPEYGRIHTDAFGTGVSAEDILRIAQGHRAATMAARRLANRILLLDTDPVLTAVWAQMLLGQRLPALEAGGGFDRPADLYLLTDIDVPWEDDGTRYFPDEARRARFRALCQAELNARGLPYVTLSGSWDDRFAAATRAIAARFAGLESGPNRSSPAHDRDG